MKNVIILTGGLAGSSVLTALLSKAGYWVGGDTIKKSDYNTWENAKLVELNNKILSDANFVDDWVMEFDPGYIDKVASSFGSLDHETYGQFYTECERHRPWIWKDPRLWLTIRYWSRFFDKNDVFFLTIRREGLQAWISTTLRRQIQTYGHARRYNDGINRTISDFLVGGGYDYLDILYEDLLLHPEVIIEKINRGAGVALTVEDFKSVFRGGLYKKQHGLWNFTKACAVYLKNYRSRHV